MGATASHHSRWIMAALALLMAATRFHHEGTAFSLPDASLAVFFLLGWYGGGPLAFAGFFLAACAIDYAAIAHMGVSDYCVTPAYGFLIPTYAALWWAGRRSGRAHVGDALPWGRIALALPLATTVAFVISNGSFFLLSGRLDGADWVAYSLGVLRDYPGYLGAAVIYSGCALALDTLARTLAGPEYRWAKSK